MLQGTTSSRDVTQAPGLQICRCMGQGRHHLLLGGVSEVGAVQSQLKAQASKGSLVLFKNHMYTLYISLSLRADVCNINKKNTSFVIV